MENKKLPRMRPLPPKRTQVKDESVVDKKSAEKVWQVNTYNDLCASKVIVASHAEVMGHIDKVVKITEEYRKTMTPEVLSLVEWQQEVTQEELERSVSLIIIDKIRRTNWKKIFFTMEGINVKNLKSFVDYVIRKDNKTNQKNLNASNK